MRACDIVQYMTLYMIGNTESVHFSKCKTWFAFCCRVRKVMMDPREWMEILDQLDPREERSDAKLNTKVMCAHFKILHM